MLRGNLALGLFWFAWISRPDIHWAWSIAARVSFGFGVVLITIGSTNYLVDSYTTFAAFEKLGVQWALKIPAGLVLVLYCHGRWVRSTFKPSQPSDAIKSRLGHSPTNTTWFLG
jgi:hypothetical protein